MAAGTGEFKKFTEEAIAKFNAIGNAAGANRGSLYGHKLALTAFSSRLIKIRPGATAHRDPKDLNRIIWKVDESIEGREPLFNLAHEFVHVLSGTAGGSDDERLTISGENQVGWELRKTLRRQHLGKYVGGLSANGVLTVVEDVIQDPTPNK